MGGCAWFGSPIRFAFHNGIEVQTETETNAVTAKIMFTAEESTVTTEEDVNSGISRRGGAKERKAKIPSKNAALNSLAAVAVLRLLGDHGPREITIRILERWGGQGGREVRRERKARSSDVPKGKVG